MFKAAIYGKGGIGKSTIASNISAALARQGLKVMQIGCDPKADSTSLLCGRRIDTILELTRTGRLTADNAATISPCGVICAESGGPVPGTGCAGRGIINALESLERLGVYDRYKPDIVIYDVLGDVVCGGFSMPMRKGYADMVYVVTDAEKMSRYAAANICMAVDNFKGRGYASLGGIILNKRTCDEDDLAASELASDFDTTVVGAIDRCEELRAAGNSGKLIYDTAPDSTAAAQIESIAQLFGRHANA